MKKLLYPWLLLAFSLPALAQDIFLPPTEKVEISAIKILEHLTIDGKLDEPAWRLAPVATGFTQVEPNQGDSVHLQTEVKILYNDQFLYIGAFCQDSLGKKALRVPDLRRDFNYFTHDLFGVSIDAFQDQRNALVFQTNPYSAQRDLQAFDDQFYDRDWDGYWKVRTTRTDSGWVAEMQLPWATIRYPKRDTQEWGINFYRIARRLNELSAWSPFPRAFTPYRMSYAGVIKGLQPPPPTPNIRIQPYTLIEAKNENTETGDYQYAPKVGGEVKWAATPNTVIDATFNTDFAQADVDRQVVNLSRFSIYFPERRQFFLENASLFSAGYPGSIEPFFSRRIGLDDSGASIPINAGLRLTNRTARKSLGALLINQQETDGTPAATFAVARYSQNVGKQNRVGALVTSRFDAPKDTLNASQNYTATIDGFFRLLQPLSWNVMLSASQTTGKGGDGIAAYSSLRFAPNWVYAYVDNAIVTQDYNPEAGFISRSNYIATNPGFYLNWRPDWRPGFIRSFEPGAYLNMYHDASTGSLLEREWTFFLIWIRFQDGGILATGLKPTYQNLSFPFSPLGIPIAPGAYNYLRYYAKYTSDLSRKLSGEISYENGGFYNGHLTSYKATLNTAPIPNIYFSINYELNSVQQLGEEAASGNYHLISTEMRLALNPRLQLNGFYQYVEAFDQANWNVRFSWEFQPLSFLYLVFNDTRYNTLENPLKTRQVIGKVTYLKQF